MSLDRRSIDKLIKKIIAEGTDLYISSGASDNSITSLERELTLELPEDYKDFLRSYGMIHCCGESIAGIFEDQIDEKSEGTVLFETLRFRQDRKTNQDAFFIALSFDNQEWFQVLNTKDSKVYGFDVLAQEYVKQFNSFDEYLIDFLQSQLD